MPSMHNLSIDNKLFSMVCDQVYMCAFTSCVMHKLTCLTHTTYQCIISIFKCLSGLYDPNSREVVVVGHGRLPINEEATHGIMGVPRSDTNVDYKVPTDTQLELAQIFFMTLDMLPKPWMH